MTPGVRSARTQTATERAVAAALKITDSYQLDPALAAGVQAYHKKDAPLTLMLRMEGIADLLEALAAQEPVPNGAQTAVKPKRAPKSTPKAPKRSGAKNGGQ